MATTAAVQTGPPKKLLSLDGGGVKGVSSLLILQAIMREVERIEDGTPAVVEQTKPGTKVSPITRSSTERKPSDYFDLTGGTSTGGIIAVMTSRLNMNCTDALGLYGKLAEDIFAVRACGINFSKTPILDKLTGLVLGVRVLFGSQFSSEYLDRSIDDIVKDNINPNERCDNHGQPFLVNPRYHSPDARGKMLMCATIANRGKALLFRDYIPPADAIPETGQQEEGEEPAPPAPPYPKAGLSPARQNDRLAKCLHEFKYDRVTIKQAVRATSAAPTYLPPEEIQNIEFWDGGLLNNNPIDQVWAARYDLASTQHAEPYVSTVLSLGCTYSTLPPKESMGIIGRLLGILGKTVGFASNVEAKHLDFKRNIYRRNLRQPGDQMTNYFRFNVGVDSKVGLADYKAMPMLEKKTKEYLANCCVQKKIFACASHLAKRKAPGVLPPACPHTEPSPDRTWR